LYVFYDYLAFVESGGEVWRAISGWEVRVRVGASGTPKDPFSAALDALRDQLRSGRLVSGESLTITDLAHDLGLSATPVREALSRLAGERLIEDRRGRGYFAPRLDVSDLVELYGLRRLYLVEALSADGGPSTFPAPEPRDPAHAAFVQMIQLFDWIVARAGNRALFDVYRQLGERLAPAVRVESQIFPVADELAELAAGLDDPARLRTILARLHAARRARAPELMRALRAGENIASL
jgi:DNA-binding GntR family transcriptional regulator